MRPRNDVDPLGAPGALPLPNPHGVPQRLARGRIFARLDALADGAHQFRRHRDADFLDVLHGRLSLYDADAQEDIDIIGQHFAPTP